MGQNHGIDSRIPDTSTRSIHAIRSIRSHKPFRPNLESQPQTRWQAWR